jgi:hypothetical protein
MANSLPSNSVKHSISSGLSELVSFGTYVYLPRTLTGCTPPMRNRQPFCQSLSSYRVSRSGSVSCKYVHPSWSDKGRGPRLSCCPGGTLRMRLRCCSLCSLDISPHGCLVRHDEGKSDNARSRDSQGASGIRLWDTPTSFLSSPPFVSVFSQRFWNSLVSMRRQRIGNIIFTGSPDNNREWLHLRANSSEQDVHQNLHLLIPGLPPELPAKCAPEFACALLDGPDISSTKATLEVPNSFCCCREHPQNT